MSTWLCFPQNMPSGGTIQLSTGPLVVPAGVEEDLVYINNRPYSIDGADQVLQAIRKNLKSWLGEWFLDTNLGTPWTQLILVHNPTVADAALKAVIAGTNGVIQINSFSYTYNPKAGLITVTFSVQSEEGPIPGVVEVFT